jgi:hypothetical protein
MSSFFIFQIVKFLEALERLLVKVLIDAFSYKVVKRHFEGIGNLLCASMEGAASPRSYLPIITRDNI